MTPYVGRSLSTYLYRYQVYYETWGKLGVGLTVGRTRLPPVSLVKTHHPEPERDKVIRTINSFRQVGIRYV